MKPRSRKLWSKEEMDQLILSAPKMSIAELMPLFPGRAGGTIRGVCQRLIRQQKVPAGWRPKLGTPRRGVRWDEGEINTLRYYVGHASIDELRNLIPRHNRHAIERMCHALGFGPKRGTWTVERVKRETGYDSRQIKRARNALHQEWKRYGRKVYMISEEQVNAIVDYLRREKHTWARNTGYTACLKCGTTGTGPRERHNGDGLCKACWDRRRRARRAVLERFHRLQAGQPMRGGKLMLLTEELWRELGGTGDGE